MTKSLKALTPVSWQKTTWTNWRPSFSSSQFTAGTWPAGEFKRWKNDPVDKKQQWFSFYNRWKIHLSTSTTVKKPQGNSLELRHPSQEPCGAIAWDCWISSVNALLTIMVIFSGGCPTNMHELQEIWSTALGVPLSICLQSICKIEGCKIQ